MSHTSLQRKAASTRLQDKYATISHIHRTRQFSTDTIRTDVKTTSIDAGIIQDEFDRERGVETWSPILELLQKNHVFQCSYPRALRYSLIYNLRGSST